MVALLKSAAKAVAGEYARKYMHKGIKAASTWVRRKYYGKRGTRKARSRTGATVTTQRDAVSSYGGGRGSRSFRRFRARVRAALIAEQPPQIYQQVYKNSVGSSGGDLSSRGVYLCDVNVSSWGDIWNVFKDAYSLSATTDAENRSIYLKSAMLKLQLRNASSDATGSECFVSVYHLVARQDIDTNEEIGNLYATYFSDMSDVGSTAASHPSMSPYSCPNFLKDWKILKVTRIKLKKDESAEFTLRKSFNRRINGRIIQDIDCAKRGITHALMFQVHGTATNSEHVSGSGLGGFTINYSSQSTIWYRKIDPDQTETIGQSK